MITAVWALVGAVVGAVMYLAYAVGKVLGARRAIARDLEALWDLHDLMALWWEEMRFHAERLGLDPPPPLPPLLGNPPPR